jgi:hypothetical protein
MNAGMPPLGGLGGQLGNLNPLQIQYLQQQMALQQLLQNQYRGLNAVNGTAMPGGGGSGGVAGGGTGVTSMATSPSSSASVSPNGHNVSNNNNMNNNASSPLGSVSTTSSGASTSAMAGGGGGGGGGFAGGVGAGRNMPHMTLATSLAGNGSAASSTASGLPSTTSSQQLEAELAQQFHYHLQLQHQLQQLRPTGNMANLSALLYPQLFGGNIAGLSGGGTAASPGGGGGGGGGGGAPNGAVGMMPSSLGSPGGGLANYDVEQYHQSIPRLGGNVDDLISPDTTPSMTMRGLPNGNAPSPMMPSMSRLGAPSASPRMGGKPRTPGGGQFRFLSRAQQQAALQDDLTALKHASNNNNNGAAGPADILDVAQFVDETPDAGDPLTGLPLSIGNIGGIPPPPPPPSRAAIPSADGSPQAPRAELEDSYRGISCSIS